MTSERTGWEQLGERISECRQNKHMTQEEMAARIGVTPQALSKWERNQSMPDIGLLSDICFVLGVSADYLLGTQSQKITENGDKKIQNEIWYNLQNCLAPLEIIFGKNLIPFFTGKIFLEKVISVRRTLSIEGILMPIVRVRDDLRLGDNEFMVLSYDNVLYSEVLQETADNGLNYIMKKLEETVREKYADILTPDIIKNLVDNLQVKKPAIINGIVPEKISYGILTEVVRNILNKGDSICYLEKIIENMDSVMRQKENMTVEELTEEIAKKMESKNNVWVVLGQRK